MKSMMLQQGGKRGWALSVSKLRHKLSMQLAVAQVGPWRCWGKHNHANWAATATGYSPAPFLT